jgi:hypothetical protein
MEKKKYQKSENWYNRFETKQINEPTDEELGEIKRLLVKWKYGFLSPIDCYRVCSIYYHLYKESVLKSNYVVDDINYYCKKLYELVK